MAGRYIPPVRVDITIPQLWNEILIVSEEFPGLDMKAVELLLTHIAVEVGLDSDGSYTDCYNYAIGNKRPRTKSGVLIDDYTMYGCGEELPLAQAIKLDAESPLATITKKYNRVQKDDKGKVLTSIPYASIEFKPPHPYARFRAFPNLREAARGMLRHLFDQKIYWSGLLTGDPVTYAKTLIAIPGRPYYTASLARYTQALIAREKQVKAITTKLDWGDFV